MRKKLSDLVKDSLSKDEIASVPQNVFYSIDDRYGAWAENQDKSLCAGIREILNGLAMSPSEFWRRHDSDDPSVLLGDALSWNDGWSPMRQRKNIAEHDYLHSLSAKDAESVSRLLFFRGGDSLASVLSYEWSFSFMSHLVDRSRIDFMGHADRRKLVFERISACKSLAMPAARDKVSLLGSAVNTADREIVAAVLNKSPPLMLDFRVRDGNTPLTRALSRKMSDVAKLLIDAGASTTAVGMKNRSPMETACRVGWLQGVEMLMNAGAGCNIGDCVAALGYYVKMKSGHDEISGKKFANANSLRIASKLFGLDFLEITGEKIPKDDFEYKVRSLLELKVLSVKHVVGAKRPMVHSP